MTQVVCLIRKQFLKYLVHLTALSQLHGQEGKIQGFGDLVCSHLLYIGSHPSNIH
jgi:hypothetical protein